MKIRLGYVSNSSSSSFIVKLQKGFVITPESIHLLMFGTTEDHQVQCYGDPFSSHLLAGVVASDLLAKDSKDEQRLHNELSNLRDNAPEYEDFQIPLSDKEASKRFWNSDQKDENNAHKLHKKHELEIFMNKNKEFETYVISYGDEDGAMFSLLEHGGYLDSFSERISHH